MVKNLPAASIRAAARIAIAAASCLFLATPVAAQALLMTLSVESSQVQRDYEFVLTLEIYAPASPNPPEVTIDGMTQFEIGSRRRNLQQVPGGRTVKWIFTYALTPTENGSYKLGPARAESGGRSYYSNTLFVTVEGKGRPSRKEQPSPPSKQQPQPKQPQLPQQQAPPTPPEPKPQPQAQTPASPPPHTKAQTQAPPPKPEPPKPQPQAPQPKPQPPVPQPQAKQPPVPQQQQPKSAPQPPVSQPPPQQPKPQPQIPPPPPPPPPPKPITDADIRDKVLVVMESNTSKAYKGEGVRVTFRLLSQLPVENLSYLVEPEFPGFLKYDYPFTSNPKAERVRYKDADFVAYELQKFLIFPLESGARTIPGVRCALRIRIPSHVYDMAETRLDVERDSNTLRLQVEPVEPSLLVGRFTLRNEILSDAPQIKIIRLILEGDGQLSTFDFPAIRIPEIGETPPAATGTAARLQGDKLKSRKTADYNLYYYDNNTINITIPEVTFRQLDPGSGNVSRLRLPALPLLFAGQAGAPKKSLPAPLPSIEDPLLPLVLSGAALPLVFSIILALRPRRVVGAPRLRPLLRKKNPKLQISRNASLWVYQQILRRIAVADGTGGGLIETLKRHLPEEEWLPAERVFRKLEFNAFAKSTPVPLTYEELQEICHRVEKRWLY